MNLQTNSQASRGEEELISKSVKGNQDALDQLFAHYARALYPTALRLLGSLEDAEDALQDALLSVFRNLGRFEARSQFSTWLTRIVINTALMRLRSQRAHPVASLDGEGGEEDELTLADKLRDPAPDPKELCAQAELEGLVERHLKVLSPALRSAWLLREVEGLSTEEASEALGVSGGDAEIAASSCVPTTPQQVAPQDREATIVCESPASRSLPRQRVGRALPQAVSGSPLP